MTKDTPNPPGGAYRREADGATPNGVCEEAAFFGATGKLLGRLDAQAYLEMIKAGAAFYASFGYTTVQEGRAMPGSATMLAEGGRGRIARCRRRRLSRHLTVAEGDRAHAQVQEPRPHRRRQGDHRRVASGQDGVPLAALSRTPEGKDADYRGYAAITKEQIVNAVDLAFANDWQILTHANGDAAVDWLIEAVGKATAKHGAGDRRAVLVHGQTTRLDQLPKLKELAIFPSFFPMHTYYWATGIAIRFWGRSAPHASRPATRRANSA